MHRAPRLLLGFLTLAGLGCHDEPAPSTASGASATTAEVSAEARAALGRARELFALDQPFEAIHAAEEAVKLAPDWAEARLALGKLLLTYSDVRFSVAVVDRGRLGEAVQDLERACELDPRNADALYWAGQALFKADRFADAMRRLERAVALNPEHGLARRELGFVHGAQGDSQRAVECLLEARKLLPKDGDLELQLGNQLEAEGRLEEARDAYLAACRFNPTHPGPRSALAVLYGRLGDPEAAERMRQEFERCRAAGKRFTAAQQYFNEHTREPAACMGLAELYREFGMHEEAIHWAERALRLDPTHEPAIELLRKLGKPVKKEELLAPDGTPLEDVKAIAPGGDASNRGEQR